MKRERISVYIQSAGANINSIKEALSWIASLKKQVGVIAIPDKQNLKGAVAEVLGDKVVLALKKNQPVKLESTSLSLLTQRTNVSTTPEVALVIYPNAKLLNKIDNLYSLTHAIVIPWSLGEVSNWITSWNAHELGQKPQPTPKFSNPIVEEALKMLTDNVNVSTGITHPLDRMKTIDLFKRLLRAKVTYSPEEIRGWLIRNGWDANDADSVMDIANKILQRRQIRNSQSYWSDDIIDQLKDRVNRS